jgi:hypothetical protein
MARIWIEPCQGHAGPPLDYWGSEESHWRASTLIPKNVLMVNVPSFTFQFFSIDQIRDCLAYYERETHPSSRLSIPGEIDHGEAQRWFDRLHGPETHAGRPVQIVYPAK